MNASVAYRWRNAEMLVLAPLYGKQVDNVLSRTARNRSDRAYQLDRSLPKAAFRKITRHKALLRNFYE